MAQMNLKVNGKGRSVDADQDIPLLYALRDQLGLNGPKFGFGKGQCGYCINGMIMTATALLAKNKNPSDQQIQEALAGNLCRCGTHQRIVAAVKRAITA